MTVRAFAPPTQDSKTGNEIVGAKCDLVSDEIRASVVTPQVVILPTFKQRDKFPNRGVPGSIAVTCTAGNQVGQALATVKAKEATVATGAGLFGALLTAAVTSAVASSTAWQFQPVINVGVTEQ